MYKFVETLEIEKWVEMNKKYTVSEIANITGRNPKTIGKYFKKINYTPNTYFERLYYKKYTIKEIIDIHVAYMADDNLSLRSVAKANNISPQNLIKRFKSLKLNTKNSYTVAHKKVNDCFFNEINSQEKAYLLGFFAADGHLEKRRDYYSYCIKIAVNEKDVEILQFYNKYLSNNLCNIRRVKKTMLEIAIHSREMGEALSKLGYCNRKTYKNNKIPDINADLTRHFIRGYIDGDGSIMYNKRKRGANRKLHIVSYSKSILVDILSYFPKTQNKIYWKYETNVTKLIKGNPVLFKSGISFSICDKATLKLIYHYLYDDATLYLTRKKEKFQQIIN